MIFLRINLPNFVQFKQYRGPKSESRVLLFKAIPVAIVNKFRHRYLNSEKDYSVV